MPNVNNIIWAIVGILAGIALIVWLVAHTSVN